MDFPIKIIKPDDFHVHLRDNEFLKDTVYYSSLHFAKVLVMPNLIPPVTSISMAENYRNRILESVPSGKNFQPLMTLYLNQNLSLLEIKKCSRIPWLLGIKLYPAGATTHSEFGVSRIEDYYLHFEVMEEYSVPLMVHAEVPDYDIDFFDREKVFLDKYLETLRNKFPKLKIVLEHVSTKEGVEFVNSYSNIGATVTPQHLLLTRNDLFHWGLHPHHYCLPIVKTSKDREAIIEQIIKGNPKFFAGTDSAPHPVEKKETSFASAGIFNAPVSVPLYTKIFDDYKALHNLENFLSKFGADFYNLEYNQEFILIEKQETKIPESYPLGVSKVIPIWAGKTISYSVKEL